MEWLKYSCPSSCSSWPPMNRLKLALWPRAFPLVSSLRFLSRMDIFSSLNPSQSSQDDSIGWYASWIIPGVLFEQAGGSDAVVNGEKLHSEFEMEASNLFRSHHEVLTLCIELGRNHTITSFFSSRKAILRVLRSTFLCPSISFSLAFDSYWSYLGDVWDSHLCIGACHLQVEGRAPHPWTIVSNTLNKQNTEDGTLCRGLSEHNPVGRCPHHSLHILDQSTWKTNRIENEPLPDTAIPQGRNGSEFTIPNSSWLIRRMPVCFIDKHGLVPTSWYGRWSDGIGLDISHRHRGLRVWLLPPSWLVLPSHSFSTDRHTATLSFSSVHSSADDHSIQAIQNAKFTRNTRWTWIRSKNNAFGGQTWLFYTFAVQHWSPLIDSETSANQYEMQQHRCLVLIWRPTLVWNSTLAHILSSWDITILSAFKGSAHSRLSHPKHKSYSVQQRRSVRSYSH